MESCASTVNAKNHHSRKLLRFVLRRLEAQRIAESRPAARFLSFHGASQLSKKGAAPEGGRPLEIRASEFALRLQGDESRPVGDNDMV